MNESKMPSMMNWSARVSEIDECLSVGLPSLGSEESPFAVLEWRAALDTSLALVTASAGYLWIFRVGKKGIFLEENAIAPPLSS
jgi:hypothetical protein